MGERKQGYQGEVVINEENREGLGELSTEK